MLKSPSSSRPGRTGEPRESNRRRRVVTIAVIVLAALIVTATALVLVRDDQKAGESAPSDVPSATTGTAPTAEATTEPTPDPSVPPTGRRSATEAVGPFLSRAATLDRRLTEAAAAINAAGPPWTEVSPALARQVQAADLDPVVSAFPAGMPDDLRQATVLVLSDLYSRRYAMESFAYPGPKHQTTEQLMSELRNGHAAAARFDRDLATARSLAAATPPIAPVPKESRLTAEALLLVAIVHNANAGGDVRGGAVITRLPMINWGPVPGDAQADGTIGMYKLPFHARFINGNWEVYLLVG
jgi:hypothetical protein